MAIRFFLFRKILPIIHILLFVQRQSDYKNDARHFSRLMDVDAAHISLRCYGFAFERNSVYWLSLILIVCMVFMCDATTIYICVFEIWRLYTYAEGGNSISECMVRNQCAVTWVTTVAYIVGVQVYPSVWMNRRPYASSICRKSQNHFCQNGEQVVKGVPFEETKKMNELDTIQRMVKLGKMWFNITALLSHLIRAQQTTNSYRFISNVLLA